MLCFAVSVLLPACASTTSARVPIDLPDLPASQTQCRLPVMIPDTALNQSQVEKFWIRDRQSLVDCRAQLTGIVNLYEDLDRSLNQAGTAE